MCLMLCWTEVALDAWLEFLCNPGSYPTMEWKGPGALLSGVIALFTSFKVTADN